MQPTLPPRPRLDVRFFIWCPSGTSGTLYGPLLSEANAHALAKQRSLSGYSIKTSNELTDAHFVNLVVVTEKRK